MSNLNLDTVSPGQASKEATINLAIAELEAAMTEMITYDLSSNHAALLIDEQRATRLHCTGVPSGGTTLTMVAVKRAIIISNGGTGTLSVVMGSTTVTVPPGIKQPVYCDGTTNGIELIGGSGLPAGGTDGQVLTKVSGSPAWAAPSGGGGGGGGTSGTTAGAHKAWRMRVTASQQTEIAEFELHATPGGAPQIGTGFAGNVSTGSGSIDNRSDYAPALAFDSNNATTWMSHDTAVNNVIGVIYAVAKSVAEAKVTPAPTPTLAPAGVVFEYSDDTTTGFDGTWSTAWTTTFASWTGGTAKTSADPSYGVLSTGMSSGDTPFYRATDIIKPTTSLFTNGIEQNSGLGATASNTTRGFFFKIPAALPTLKQAILTKALPATPYTVKVLALPMGNFADYSAWGIVHTDGSNKNVMFDMSGNNTNGSRFDIQQNSGLGSYNSDAPFSNNVVNKNIVSPTWLKLQDDGTNVAFLWSADGEFWHFLHSQSRTTYLTPTKLGLTLFLGTPTETAGDLGIHVFSYSETAGIV